jgi:uncharacterized membrane protein
MNTSLKNRITTKQLAAMAIFAALYVVIALITTTIGVPIGVGPIVISIAALIASIFGIILGPYLGAITALLGSTVSWALLGMTPYDAPFILAPMFNALIVGLIFYKKWKYAFAVFTIMIITFLCTPPVTPLTGQSALADFGIPIVANWYIAAAVLFDKLIALALILPLAFFGKKMSFAYGSAFFFILFFIGNQADNIWGTLIFASSPIIYNGIFGMDLAMVQIGLIVSPFLYPAIRIVQALIATIIIIPLIRVLQTTNWLWSENHILADT